MTDWIFFSLICEGVVFRATVEQRLLKLSGFDIVHKFTDQDVETVKISNVIVTLSKNKCIRTQAHARTRPHAHALTNWF